MISDLKLERFLLDELPRDEQLEIRMLALEDPELAQRIDALRDSDAAFLKDHPAHLNSAIIRERLKTAEHSLSTQRYYPTRFSLAGIAVACLVIVAVNTVPVSYSTQKDTTRIKGLQPHLSIFRDTAGSVEKLDDGSSAIAGDKLQLIIHATNHSHAAVASVDGRGIITLHHPETSRSSTALNGKQKLTLPAAYELDDAPDFERFYLVTDDHAIDIAKMIKAIRGKNISPNTNPSLKNIPSSWAVDVLTLVKD